MKITVKTLDGKINLEVENDDTIESVKQQIQDKKGIPPDEQLLIFKGLYLNNKFTVRNYMISDEDTIDYVHFPDGYMKIYIKNLEEGTFPLNVKPTDSIKSIKEQIRDKKGIPLCEQLLIFKGIYLKDKFTVLNYIISSEDTIDYVHLPGGYMKIYIKDLEEETICLNVKPTDSIKSIKEQIQNKKGIPPYEQLLMFKGLCLKDEYTLDDYSIENGETFEYVHLPGGYMKIYIKDLDDETICLDVKPTDSIKSIKEQIRDKKGIPLDEQDFTFKRLYLRDEYKVQDYNIKNESILKFRNPGEYMKTHIKNLDEGTISLDVKSSDSIKSVKEQKEEKKGNSPDLEYLKIEVRKVKDEDIQ